ncbi:NUDIX hydrolase [Niameybacter massiliensis]|uniref:NUDIX hydrolase n=1 Tax=Niameybacter massiliensis TaxID=1658108 RepID=UPI0006B43B77|nr:NUDIX domain-containing protein [Niameybacter massiliensis]
MEVKFYDVNEIEDSLLFAAVIVAQYKGKWILCKHKERDTWEVPGGHREESESILETAKRELYEETGAKQFDIVPICAYSLRRYAMLFFAEITVLDDLPPSEIERIEFFTEIPTHLTYPLLHSQLIDKVKESFTK